MRLLKRLFAGRALEADLNAEAAKAATYYLKKTNQMHFVDYQQAVNWVAAGFAMGFRFHEKTMGITRKDSHGKES